MKNVTIALDDDTHRQARIRAAEMGTSLSALVKDYLTGLTSTGLANTGLANTGLADDVAALSPPTEGVREMHAGFKAAPVEAPANPGGPPWLVDGKWVYTRDGKPRQPGALRHLPDLPDDFDTWTPELEAAFSDLFKPWNDDDFTPLP